MEQRSRIGRGIRRSPCYLQVADPPAEGQIMNSGIFWKGLRDQQQEVPDISYLGIMYLRGRYMVLTRPISRILSIILASR